MLPVITDTRHRRYVPTYLTRLSSRLSTGLITHRRLLKNIIVLAQIRGMRRSKNRAFMGGRLSAQLYVEVFTFGVRELSQPADSIAGKQASLVKSLKILWLGGPIYVPVPVQHPLRQILLTLQYMYRLDLNWR